MIPRVESFSGRHSTRMSTAASRSSSRSAGQRASTYVGLVDREHVGGQDAGLEGGQQLGQPPADAPKPDDAHRAAGQIAGGPADELLLLLGAEERRQAAAPAGHQGDRVLGHLIGQHARGAGDHDVRGDHRGDQAVVHAGGRRLDPPQPALPHHAVPIDRHLGVAAEDVGPKQFLGDPLLAGVDDLGLRHGGGDLLDVLRLRPGNRGRFASTW